MAPLPGRKRGQKRVTSRKVPSFIFPGFAGGVLCSSSLDPHIEGFGVRFGGTGRAGCEPVAGRDAPEDRLQRGDQGEKGEGERGDQLRGI